MLFRTSRGPALHKYHFPPFTYMDVKLQHELIATLAEVDSELENIRFRISQLQNRLHDLEKRVLYETGDEE